MPERQRRWKHWGRTLAQGVAIGAANAAPGLSGATIAFISGIFERIVSAVASMDFRALRLLCRGEFAALARHIDLGFLAPLILGMGLGLVLLARLLELLFAALPQYLWAFFFGLVLASVFSVGKGVQRWSAATRLCLLAGTLAAIGVALLPPAAANASFWYLVLCGAVAMCSMILPGLSGSFVLILLGNYQLVMVQGVGQLQLAVLLPFMLGAAAGALSFTHLLHWLMQHGRNQTTALLCGFIAGSLGSLWPWRSEDYEFADQGPGMALSIPEWNGQLAIALICMLLGAASVFAIEQLARRRAPLSSPDG